MIHALHELHFLCVSFVLHACRNIAISQRYYHHLIMTCYMSSPNLRSNMVFLHRVKSDNVACKSKILLKNWTKG
jgi:hypothetical protein